MILKLIRRAIVIWVGYGIVKLCILLNPYLFALARLTGPNFDEGQPLDHTDPTQVIIMWFTSLLAIGLLCLAVYLIHRLTAWIFGE